MLLRPLLVKKIACGLGRSDRFKSIYAALYFFPILTVLQAVGGGLLCELCLFTDFSEHFCRNCSSDAHCSFCLSDYAFPYIILVLSLVTLAVYMSASEVQVKTHNASPTADRFVSRKQSESRCLQTLLDLCNCLTVTTL